MAPTDTEHFMAHLMTRASADQVAPLVHAAQLAGDDRALEVAAARVDIPVEVALTAARAVAGDACSVGQIARADPSVEVALLLLSTVHAADARSYLSTATTRAPVLVALVEHLAADALAARCPAGTEHPGCAATLAGLQNLARPRMEDLAWVRPEIGDALRQVAGAWSKGCPHLIWLVRLWGHYHPQDAAEFVARSNRGDLLVEAISWKWATEEIRARGAAALCVNPDPGVVHGLWDQLDPAQQSALLATDPDPATTSPRLRAWWHHQQTGRTWAPTEYATADRGDLHTELVACGYWVPHGAVAAVIERRDVSTKIAELVVATSQALRPGAAREWRTWDRAYQLTIYRKNVAVLDTCTDVDVILEIAAAEPDRVAKLALDRADALVAKLGDRVWDLPWSVFSALAPDCDRLSELLLALALEGPLMVATVQQIVDAGGVALPASRVRHLARAALSDL